MAMEMPHGTSLTPQGVQRLRKDAERDEAVVVLQVLGVFRYILDPAAKRVLPADVMEHADRDLFDVVVSDGQMKMKCVLSPTLNGLVWKNGVPRLSLVDVSEWTVLKDTTESVHAVPSVCLLRKIAFRTSDVSDQIVHPAASPQPVDVLTDVQFVSKKHEREHTAIPLIGERLYYLSLLADDVPVELDPSPGLLDALTPTSNSRFEWNRRRRYCSDLFQHSDRVIHTIREANIMTGKRKRETDGKDASPPPPMIGIVHFKSKLTHLGVPSLDNPFPWMFYIVISDWDRSVEVAFFGSMVSANFLTIQEGDAIQLLDYIVDRSTPQMNGGKPKKLFFFPHGSHGVVSHVPAKFWKLLEISRVLPAPLERSADSNKSHLWIEPTFLTTLDLQDWDPPASEDQDGTMFFDFVGVVSYVGRVHRQRTPKSSNPIALEAFRWIKVIDRSSSSEMVVLLGVCSQPSLFESVKAGDSIMITKLKWLHGSSDQQWEYATTSVYSFIRLNEDIEFFSILDDVSVNNYFAKSTLKPSIKTLYSSTGTSALSTESWIEGVEVENHQPLHALPRDLMTFATTLNLDVLSLSEAVQLSEDMDALLHRHVLVNCALNGAKSTSGSQGDEISIELGEGDLHRSVRVRSNPLFRAAEPPRVLLSSDAWLFAHSLPPQAINSLVAMVERTQKTFDKSLSSGSRRRSSTSSSSSQPPVVSLAEVVKVLQEAVGKTSDLTFSLHVYKSVDGQVEMTVDSIFLDLDL
ncbi:hypothetical protein Poli38472_014077 [Pythium oligandrum]|uniref:Uncharacterized protein n=1 Tax=Pythium oligandrum TaxID=41045 RepID=A0A8K1FK56_PYTOL|nr:hypothetical protein Poli38472_014077 [Pythium oligandrum]|eukprot:TMW66765.1 hypothetical protein Poli38472_014077 [Pythium oligandrum]